MLEMIFTIPFELTLFVLSIVILVGAAVALFLFCVEFVPSLWVAGQVTKKIYAILIGIFAIYLTFTGVFVWTCGVVYYGDKIKKHNVMIHSVRK